MKLTKEQISSVFESRLGHPPRAADVWAVEAMGGTVDVLAEYIWDHWLGEPEELSLEEVKREVRDALESKSEGGYTLVELIVALAAMSIGVVILFVVAHFIAKAW